MAAREDIVKQAQAWIGYNESNRTHRIIIDTYNAHKPLARGYKVQYNDEWCATFASAVAIKCGATDIIPTECSCTKMIELFKAFGSWVETDSYKPKAGDFILYDWQDSGKGENIASPDHIGIVEKVVGNKITVIEGNYKQAVGRRELEVNGRYIRGYGVPKYSVTVDIDKMAQDVISGKYGSGAQRKAALGVHYDAVQKRVNELLKKPAKKSVTEVAKEVIQGKWGSGVTRRLKLTAAGYNYNDVQRKVNELLR